MKRSLIGLGHSEILTRSVGDIRIRTVVLCLQPSPVSYWKGTLFTMEQTMKTCWQCTGQDGRAKKIYLTKEEAMDAARYIKYKRGVDLQAYRCEWSGGWHLTKSERGEGWYRDC